MRYLVLTDIHANLEALEAVLADAPQYDAVLSLGDLVGYGPSPNEVIERVRGLPNVTGLKGNHDLAALEEIDLSTFNPHARAAAEWTAEQMTAESRDYLNSLPTSAGSPHAFLAHASPRDPVWEYMEFPLQGPPNFAVFEGPLALVGHTHVPRVFEHREGGPASAVWEPEGGDAVEVRDGTRHIVNPGGVGQPRDGNPRAAYGILDTDSGTFTFHRVAYPVQETQRKMLDAGLPEPLATRLAYGM